MVTEKKNLTKPAKSVPKAGSPKRPAASPNPKTKKKKVKKEKNKGPSYCSIAQGIFVLIAFFPASATLYNWLTWPSVAFTSPAGYDVYKPTQEALDLKLENYVFEKHFAVVDQEANLTMHYVEEGGYEDDTVLLLHDAPLWSYSFRKLIPTVSMAKIRVIAPDLIGFGFSDAPFNRSIHTMENHVKWLTALLDHLEVTEYVTVFGVGRAGLLAQTLIKNDPNRFYRLALGNSLFFTAEEEQPISYQIERYFAEYSPYISSVEMVKRNVGERYHLETVDVAAYDHGLPHYAFTMGYFPITQWSLPVTVEKAKEFEDFFKSHEKPTLILSSEDDEQGKKWAEWMKENIPGAKTQDNHVFKGKEYLQEEHGIEVGNKIIKFCNENVDPWKAKRDAERQAAREAAAKAMETEEEGDEEDDEDEEEGLDEDEEAEAEPVASKEEL